MKKSTFLKNTVILARFACCILWVASCANKQNPKNPKDVAKDFTETFENNLPEEDVQFLLTASEINLKEIKLGKLAQQKGSSTHVKQLGKMMEDAHSKSQSDLTKLTKSKMITVSSSLTNTAQEVYETLSKKSGNDFDKAYADLMVSGHKDAIIEFERVSTHSSDTDLKYWAIVSLKALRTHLDHSIYCQKQCEKFNQINKT